MEEGAEGGEAGQAGPPDADLTTEPDEAMSEGPDSRTVGSSRSERGRPDRGHGCVRAPFAVVSVVALWLSRSFWFPGRYVVGFDTYAYSGPNVQVTEEAWRNFRLPILNDLIFGGVPHLGNPSAGALYAPQLITLLFGTNRAMGILVALHLVLLGVGMVWLLRRLGIGRVGSHVRRDRAGRLGRGVDQDGPVRTDPRDRVGAVAARRHPLRAQLTAAVAVGGSDRRR